MVDSHELAVAYVRVKSSLPRQIMNHIFSSSVKEGTIIMPIKACPH